MRLQLFWKRNVASRIHHSSIAAVRRVWPRRSSRSSRSRASVWCMRLACNKKSTRVRHLMQFPATLRNCQGTSWTRHLTPSSLTIFGLFWGCFRTSMLVNQRDSCFRNSMVYSCERENCHLSRLGEGPSMRYHVEFTSSGLGDRHWYFEYIRRNHFVTWRCDFGSTK